MLLTVETPHIIPDGMYESKVHANGPNCSIELALRQTSKYSGIGAAYTQLYHYININKWKQAIT